MFDCTVCEETEASCLPCVMSVGEKLDSALSTDSTGMVGKLKRNTTINQSIKQLYTTQKKAKDCLLARIARVLLAEYNIA